MRRQAILACAALAPLLTAACGDTRAGDVQRIAVIPKGTTHEFWKAIHAGAAKASADTGAEILWKGPLREDDRDEQIKVVEDFISRGVDGIVVAPLDEKALAGVLEEAAGEGIPVVVIDSDVAWKGRVSFIATDNYLGGVLGAQRLGELMGAEGKALMMRYQEGSASTTRREAGFLDTMAKEFAGIEIVSSNQYAGATNEGAYSTAENLLNSHPGVEGIFCPNESAAFGMLRALQDASLGGKVKFVGFDPSDKMVAALRAGEMQGMVVQNPFAMGERGVKTLLAHLAGERVDDRIDTGVVMVTPENLDEAEIQTLVAPDLERWLDE